MARSVNIFITNWTVPPNATQPFSLTARFVWIDNAGVQHDQTQTLTSTAAMSTPANVSQPMQQMLIDRIRAALGVDA